MGTRARQQDTAAWWPPLPMGYVRCIPGSYQVASLSANWWDVCDGLGLVAVISLLFASKTSPRSVTL